MNLVKTIEKIRDLYFEMKSGIDIDMANFGVASSSVKKMMKLIGGVVEDKHFINFLKGDVTIMENMDAKRLATRSCSLTVIGASVDDFIKKHPSYEEELQKLSNSTSDDLTALISLIKEQSR